LALASGIGGVCTGGFGPNGARVPGPTLQREWAWAHDRTVCHLQTPPRLGPKQVQLVFQCIQVPSSVMQSGVRRRTPGGPALRSKLLSRRRRTDFSRGFDVKTEGAETFSHPSGPSYRCSHADQRDHLTCHWRDCEGRPLPVLSVFVGDLVTCTTDSSVIPVRGGEPRLRTAPRPLCS
jgi:hypothetical protein